MLPAEAMAKSRTEVEKSFRGSWRSQTQVNLFELLTVTNSDQLLGLSTHQLSISEAVIHAHMVHDIMLWMDETISRETCHSHGHQGLTATKPTIKSELKSVQFLFNDTVP